MAEVNEIIVKIPTDSAKKSLSDLKKEIQGMTNELAALEKGTKEYSETLTAIAERQQIVDQASRDVKEAIQAVREETERLNSANQTEQKTQASLQGELKKYKNDLKDLERGTDEYTATIDKIVATQAQLDQITIDLKNATNEYKNSLIDANEEQNLNIVTTQSLSKEIGELKNMLLNLDLGSEAYISTLEELNSKQERLNAVNKDVASSAAATEATFLDLGKTASAAAGGFAVAQGALKLLGVEGQDVGKAMVQLQASIALLQGLDPLIKGIKAGDVSFKAFNTTLKANPLILIASLIAGVVAVAIEFADEFSFIAEPVKELWGAIKDILPSLDQLKSFISGAGTAMVRHFLAPIKAAIELFTNGWDAAVEEYRKNMNVVANYNEGYAIQEEKNRQKWLTGFQEQNKTILSGMADRIKLAIETNESIYGSDYRYTKEGAALYESYYKTLAAMQDHNSADYEKAMNNLRNFQRQNNEKVLADQKKVQDEAAKKADEERKKREQKDKEEKDRQIAAEKEYAKTIEAVNKEALKNITDTYTGDDRKKFLIDSINLNYQLAEQAKKTADDETALWTDRSVAAAQYRSLLTENYGFQKEYDALIEEQRKKDAEQAEKEKALAEEMAAYGLIETDDQKLARLQKEIDDNKLIAESTKNSLEDRAKAWQKYIKAREEYDKTDDEIKENEKKRLRSTLQVTADFLDASTALVGENTAAGKSMAIASATISTYLSAQQAFAAMSGIPIVGPALGAVAAAAAIVAGLANIKAITSTKVPGSSEGSSSEAISAPPFPSMPEMSADFVETHNNMSGYDEERLNNTQAVLVVEDVNQAQTRVQAVEVNATY